MRKALVLLLSLSVQSAALRVPFVHVHPDEHATAHHDGRTVHTHWAHHANGTRSDLPGIGSMDGDRAQAFGVFVAVAGTSFPPIGLARGIFVLPEPVERPAHRSFDIAHGHDPPRSRLVPARAPPAPLPVVA